MSTPRYLRLEKQGEHDWAFNRPLAWDFFNRQFERAEAVELEGDKDRSIQMCLDIVENCPEYLPALNKLGLLLREKGDLDASIAAFESARSVGLACVPNDFEMGIDSIPWYWVDNRAFLLACEYLGLSYVEQGLIIFEELTHTNPGSRGSADLVSSLRQLISPWANVED
jgi:tetratricopeptide (TPR) repeat protein